jgi:transcription initiation factor TFIID subunit 4
MHAHGMPPAKVAPPPTHPMMQHNAVAWQMHQNKELKTNTLPPNANAKQNYESAGKARTVGAGNSSAKGKQVNPPNSSFNLALIWHKLITSRCQYVSVALNMNFE